MDQLDIIDASIIRPVLVIEDFGHCNIGRAYSMCEDSVNRALERDGFFHDFCGYCDSQCTSKIIALLCDA